MLRVNVVGKNDGEIYFRPRMLFSPNHHKSGCGMTGYYWSQFPKLIVPAHNIVECV